MGELEHTHHQTQRSPRGLSPRARHLVVEVGILECAQIERQRLVEDHLVHALREERPKELVAGLDPLLRTRQSGHQTELDRDEDQHRALVLRCARLARSNHPIHDPLPDPRDRRGQHPRDGAQQRERDAQPFARGPDESDRVRRVLEHAHRGLDLTPLLSMAVHDAPS